MPHLSPILNYRPNITVVYIYSSLSISTWARFKSLSRSIIQGAPNGERQVYHTGGTQRRETGLSYRGRQAERETGLSYRGRQAERKTGLSYRGRPTERDGSIIQGAPNGERRVYHTGGTQQLLMSQAKNLSMIVLYFVYYSKNLICHSTGHVKKLNEHNCCQKLNNFMIISVIVHAVSYHLSSLPMCNNSYRKIVVSQIHSLLPSMCL